MGQCPFAPGWGGGIDSWGILTLTHTAVTDNSVGAAPGLPGVASDADGGGIYSRQGSLTLTSAVVAGNDATAIIPDGRFAEGAAIFAGYSGFGPAGGDGPVRGRGQDAASSASSTRARRWRAGGVRRLGPGGPPRPP